MTGKAGTAGKGYADQAGCGGQGCADRTGCEIVSCNSHLQGGAELHAQDFSFFTIQSPLPPLADKCGFSIGGRTGDSTWRHHQVPQPPPPSFMNLTKNISQQPGLWPTPTHPKQYPTAGAKEPSNFESKSPQLNACDCHPSYFRLPLSHSIISSLPVFLTPPFIGEIALWFGLTRVSHPGLQHTYFGLIYVVARPCETCFTHP